MAATSASAANGSGGGGDVQGYQKYGLLLAEGSPSADISDERMVELLESVLPQGKSKVCIVPPDFTRFHSRAGIITNAVQRHYGDAVADVIPALGEHSGSSLSLCVAEQRSFSATHELTGLFLAVGTHAPMSDEQLEKMYGDVPKEKIRVHKWRTDVVTIGEVPADMVKKASGGHLDCPWPAQRQSLRLSRIQTVAVPSTFCY